MTKLHVFLIILVIISTIAMMFSKKRNGHSWFKYLTWCIITSALLSILVWSFIGVALTSRMDTYEAPYSTQKLIALETNRDINGSGSMLFFIGSGYVNQSLYYYFYVETESGIQFHKEKAESIYVREYDGQPKFVKYSKFFEPKYKGKNPFYDEYARGGTTIQVLYIPKGSILSEYNVDLK